MKREGCKYKVELLKRFFFYVLFCTFSCFRLEKIFAVPGTFFWYGMPYIAIEMALRISGIGDAQVDLETLASRALLTRLRIIL